MQIKDYYTILELPSSATAMEIKKAYRRLAQQYHPDKNQLDPYASAQFAEIKEAYEVLTHPGKKEHYLQQRWYHQSQGKKKSQGLITPVAVLKQSLELERYVSRLDHFRMNQQGLHDHLLELLNDETIEKLNAFNDRSTTDAILRALMDCMRPLSYPLVSSLQQQIIKLNGSDNVKDKIDQFRHEKQKAQARDRYKIWIILLLVLLFCVFVILS